MRETDIAKAERYLKAQLSTGSKLVRDLTASGIPLRTLQRAARDLDIYRSRDGRYGRWRWSVDRIDRLLWSAGTRPANERITTTMREKD